MPKANQGRATKPQPKKQTKTTKKPVAAKTKTNAQAKALNTKLPNVLSIAKTSWLILWRNRKTFSLIILIYGLVYVILVIGLVGPGNAVSAKKSFDSVFHGHFSTFYSGASVFTYLAGSSTSSSTPAGSAYQVIIVTIASLSIIWSLRQFYLGAKVRARDGYYKGLYPLVPYVLVFLFIVIELIPLIAGLGLYGALVSGGIAVTFIEKLLSTILAIALAGVSLYLIPTSVMALYIVTLPDMTPVKAIRSAKRLIKDRRWTVFRKIIFLPLLVFVAAGIIILPFIFAIPAISAWIFLILVLISLAYAHSYLYSLYRGLLNE